MTTPHNEPQNKTAFTILITVIATLGGFLFGFDSGVINGTVDGLKTTFESDSMGTGFNVASMLLGCAVGAFFAGTLADKFGRRTLLIVSALCFGISAWGSGIANGSTEFIFYRIIGGLAVGAASILAPAYISEIAPAKHRGMLTSIQQMAIISGLFIAFLSNYFIADWAGSSTDVPTTSTLALGKSTLIFAWGYEAWRMMFWVELLPAAIFFFALFCIPESPRFLVASGKDAKALKVLGDLMGAGAAPAKLADIKQSLAGDHHRPGLRDIVDPKHGLRPIVWIGITLAALQQLVGINVVFYYGAVLWQAAGFSESNALLINVISGGVSILACLVATLFVDRIGRKPLLFVGSIGMALSLTTLAIVFSMGVLQSGGNLELPGNLGIVALIAANLYVMFFNATWGPVMWIMLGEMFPNQIRGSALAVSGLSQWSTNFIITMTFPILLTSSIGLGGAYGIYAFFALVSAVFVGKFVHETKGKELEDMEG